MPRNLEQFVRRTFILQQKHANGQHLSVYRGLVQNKKKITRFNVLDNILVDFFPRYTVLKTFMGKSENGSDDIILPTPVMFEQDGALKMAFEIEKGDRLTTIYVPDAPNIWSGEVLFVPTEKLSSIEVSAIEAATLMRRLGSGAQAKLSPDLPQKFGGPRG